MQSLLLIAALLAPPTDAAEVVDHLAALRFDRLGHPAVRWDAIPAVRAPRDRPHRLLVVLAEFPDRKFERFQADAAQGTKLAAHYQHLLFDPDYARKDTLSHFYRTQSLETYHLQGHVLPPVTLSKPRTAYGAPHRPEGGDWRNDADPEGLAEEVLALAGAAHPDLDWASFDRWDPADFDGDGQRAEADGYLDHLVIVYAGGGQSACQGLYKLDDTLNRNVGTEAVAQLSPAERECADRIWPHRFMIQKREGEGPTVEGRVHARGGAPLRPTLWARDYNMQSEYTEASTFVHEFGHSLGLPDVYARETSNSTGIWELMSDTADPSPQNLSAWSRIMLGWLRPRVITPPAFGGAPVQSMYLRTLDDPLDTPEIAREKQADGLFRAALVVLPPKTRELLLTELPKASGRQALYSGQGNGLNRTAALAVDLRAVKGPVRLAFDAWWEIEGGWDFAYVEASTDGRTWQRLVPEDRRHMPAKHGHDGRDTLPGFTGLSGDLDGDGKNESAKGCDPKRAAAHGEAKATAEADPCAEPTWVRPTFDLSRFAGQAVTVRFRAFTDMAAVMRGLLIDNVEVSGIKEDFEGAAFKGWRLDGFTPSAGRHTLLVPHFYLLEHRDPTGPGYDAALNARPAYRFYWDPQAGKLRALRARVRPGVVAWYADGAFAWSENDPATNGPGQGFLLVLDSHPNELPLPGLPRQGTAAAFDTRFDTGSEATQKSLEDAYFRTMCFVREAAWRPRDLDAARCSTPTAALAALRVDGRALRYSYQIINDLLPGPERDALVPAGELLDYRRQGDQVTWRLRDRSLRSLHSYDAPFSLEDFPHGFEIFDVVDGQLVPAESHPHPATAAFTDATPARWLNPHLRFGGVAVPDSGLAFQLTAPKADAPAGARVKVWFDWR